MKLSKIQLAIVALIITNIIWGAAPPIFKWSLKNIDPFTFAFYRFFLSTLILLPFTIHKIKVSHHDFLRLILLSFIGFFLHISLFLFGLKLTSSISFPIIMSSAPVFLILGSVLLLKEKILPRTVTGTFVSLIGVLIVILLPYLREGFDGEIIGNILYVFSAISFVCYTLLLKEYKLNYSSVTVTFWLFAIATVLFFPFFLWESAGKNPGSIIDTPAAIGILFGAVFVSVVAYLLFNVAIKRVVVNEIGVYLYIDPIVTAVIAFYLLGETISFPFLVGALMVFLGIFITEKRIHYHPFHKFLRQAQDKVKNKEIRA